MKHHKRIQKICSCLLVMSLLLTSAPGTGMAENISEGTETAVQETVQPAEETGEQTESSTQTAPEVPETQEGTPSGEEKPETEAGGNDIAENTETESRSQEAVTSGEQPETEHAEASVTENTGMQEEETEKAVLEVQKEEMERPDREKKEGLPDKKEEETRVIEVSDLASFSNAVSLVTSGDDLTPAYEFTKDSAAAVIGGEEEQLSTPAAESGDSYVVPKEVFAEDDAVSSDKITDGDGMVSLDTVAEVSDYEVEQQGDTAALVNPFQNKHLIVKSEEGFDPQGAVNIIQGYDHLFVLTYRTEEETKAAYEYLQTIPYLTVEADSPYSANTQTADAEEAETVTADNHEKTAKLPESRDIVIAVLDSGYDIKGCGMERIVNGTDVTGKGDIQDENGHGTAMANIILENTYDCIKVMPVKVADADGRTSALKLYLGLRYAIENHADVINISMSAYKASNSEMVNAVIREAKAAGIHVVVSAGNAGDDVMNYSPANVEEAIVVSAVNADDTLMAYSNRGDTIDYSAYGKVQTTGLNKETVEPGGTSVSAAIVSAVIGGWKAFDNDISYDEMISLLDRNAKDLGEEGKDSLYGKGLLSLDMLRAVEDENPEIEEPELLTCDWKNLSDEKLNAVIEESYDLVLRRFLNDLTGEEKQELLSRDTLFNSEVTDITTDENGTEVSRMTDTLYNYLMSDEFSEYYIQADVEKDKTWNGSYWMYYSHNRLVYMYLDTNKDSDKAKIEVRVTQPGENQSVTAHVTFKANKSAYDFSNVSLGNLIYANDDNHPNVVQDIIVNGVKVSKPKHSTATGQSRSPEKNNEGNDPFYPSLFQSYGSNKCSADNTSGVVLYLGTTDLHDTYEQEKVTSHTLTMKFTDHNPDWGKWGEWSTVKDRTCLTDGLKRRTRTRTCSECKVKQTDTDEETVPAYGSHDFSNDPWQYEDNNGIGNGKRWLQCRRTCHEEGWQKDVEYLQQVYYRKMDVDGNYPGYSTHVNKYYAAGAVVQGWNYVETAVSEYTTAIGGIGDYYANNANLFYIDVPRKKYNVVYDGNGADGGSTPAQNNICCGKTFHLNANGFVRTGYDFKGWSKTKNGKIIDSSIAKNLSFTNGATVTLYAVWEPHVYKITLDDQGANVWEYTESGKIDDTAEVYQKYTAGYFQHSNCKDDDKFTDNKIVIPQKEIEDLSLISGRRRQQFLGYFTDKNGAGHQMIQKDGSLIANINHAGNYKYFTSDATVYAAWEDMNAIQFNPNLTDADMEIISKDAEGNTVKDTYDCPDTIWKAKGESITVSYETASVTNPSFTDIYRFRGWSLTPEIASDDEIVLSEEKNSYTFSADEDVTLYAQWNTSFNVTYVGNEQSEGIDYLDGVEDIKDSYTFNPNDEEEVALLQNDTADYFVKTIEKPTIDIATGRAEDEDGNPCMETVPYSFQGWSMYDNYNTQMIWNQYKQENGAQVSSDVVSDAIQVAEKEKGKGLTFGTPVEDYGSYNAAHDSSKKLIAGTKGVSVNELTMDELVKGYLAEKTDTPFVNMYAIWDEYPQIEISDLYYTLNDARSGILTEEFLLNEAIATDEELKSSSNPEGRMKNGEDSQNNTSFTIPDYQETDFTQADTTMSMTLNYRAEDFVGNVTRKMIRVTLVDTTPRDYDPGHVRFISKEYIDTLDEDSIWRTNPEYAAKLEYVLNNYKHDEEYTNPTPFERFLGIKPVKKPGSGTWDHVEQVWVFSHEDVLAVQEFVETYGIIDTQKEFLERFGYCRVQ